VPAKVTALHSKAKMPAASFWASVEDRLFISNAFHVWPFGR
jgi:hypothetical protein